MRPPDPLSTAHLEQQLGSDGLDAVLEKIARPLPLIVFHGYRDAIVASANASGLIDHVLAVASPDRHPGTPSAAVTRGQVTGRPAIRPRPGVGPPGPAPPADQDIPAAERQFTDLDHLG